MVTPGEGADREQADPAREEAVLLDGYRRALARAVERMSAAGADELPPTFPADAG